MKRNISDLLDAYMDERVDLNGSTPLSPSGIKALTMSRIEQKNVSRIPERSGQGRIRRSLSRSLLIAAIIALICCATAFAIVFSLRDAARMDMGVSVETPIPEWTEYEEAENTGVTDAVAADTEPRASLVATMCSFKQLYAYFEVSPIPEEIAAILADNTSPQYEWDLGRVRPKGLGCTYNVEQISYDSETQTALVKVYVRGEALEQIEQIELSLSLTHDLKEETVYDPIVIPITSGQMLSCPADITVEHTKAHFEDAFGPNAEGLNISDYVLEGKINRISICAGYIEAELERPDITEWAAISNVDQVFEQIADPEDIETLPEYRDIITNSLFSASWWASVDETLRGARLNYKDGTSEVIDQIPRAYAGVWSPNDDDSKYQFIPKQAFDLSAVESVTICDTEYPFITMDEIEP